MKKIFMLTVDGTSSGYYENAAFSILFKTHNKAHDWVDNDLLEQAMNVVEKPENAEEVSKAVRETCKWFNKNEAQFRYGDAFRDYSIEEVPLP